MAHINYSTYLYDNYAISFNEGKRTRAGSAKAHIIILLIVTETLLLTLLGSLAGYLLVTVGLLLGQPLLAHHFSLYISPYVDVTPAGKFFLMALGAAVLLSFIPALSAYKKSLLNGINQ